MGCAERLVFLLLLLSISWEGGVASNRISGTGQALGTHGINAGVAARWQLEWRPSITPPPRRLVPVRWNYFSTSKFEGDDTTPDLCAPWLQCVREQGLARTLHLTPWPPGTKVLFLGNSYVGQLAQTAVLDVPDAAIKSMHYPKTQVSRKTWICQCPLRGSKKTGYQNSCNLEDYMTLSAQNGRGAHQVDGVQYCNSWTYNETTAMDATPRYSYCADFMGVVQLHDGTVVANLINHPAQLLPLEKGVQLATGLPLSAFDVVVANRGNMAGPIFKRCGEKGPLKPSQFRRVALPFGNVVKGLSRAGFRGHLFQVSDNMWKPMQADVAKAVRSVQARGLPFSVHESSVLHGMGFEVVRRCGLAKSKKEHACMPGPTMWMVEALRAQYAAATRASTEQL
mmetsp:Transcript_47712/g.121741  ORF Transcript_47712/g.121741 Transcript_47712/m.121741 type:complete len:396 (-) Transcript_47712:111-1298(-)|eukprot:jgi/Tetstr1/438545/TSEL_027096.t1